MRRRATLSPSVARNGERHGKNGERRIKLRGKIRQHHWLLDDLALMEALKSKLEREAAPGTRLVTHTFSVHGWTAESEQTLGDLYRTHVYVYRLPVTDESGS